MDPLTRAQLVDHLSALTDAEYQAVQADARALPDLTTRQGRHESLSAKSAQLMNLSREMDKAALAAEGIHGPSIVPVDTQPEQEN
jgi:hypothetical protein